MRACFAQNGFRGTRPSGFSLVELMVVLAVTVVLAGLLLPVLSQVRENVNRVLSSSNLRQLGLAFTMYDRDSYGYLPYSYALDVLEDPRELTVLHLNEPDQWDGMGLLYAGGYADDPGVFYCPSHRGSHMKERYASEWWQPDGTLIHGNYHYGGHVDWENPERRRRLDDNGIVLASDGLRSYFELNHKMGMNILRGDGSVRWREDGEAIATLSAAAASGDIDADIYRGLWHQVETDNSPN